MTNCIDSGQAEQIDISVDDGKWHQLLSKPREERNSSNIPILPITGWKKFPSVTIPKNFNDGHMYHHIVESVQNMDIGLSYNNCSDDDSSEDEGDTRDIHTAKPLRKGKTYFTSGHVTNIVDQSTEEYYFIKCKVMSSYKPQISYDVTCTMSSSTDSRYILQTT